VQPNSGSQMNQAVFLALLQPGDTFMGLDLAAGGHLTHGSPVNMSGKWFKAVAPTACARDDQTSSTWTRWRSKAEEHKPKLIIAGGSAYSRAWDFKRFREIADSVGAYLMVDMAHFAGLVAGGACLAGAACPCHHHHHAQIAARPARRPDPHQRRGARQEDQLGVFPGLQGGPLMHVIAAKAVAFGEALRRTSRSTRRTSSRTPRRWPKRCAAGLDIVSGGTDNHLMLVDLRPKGLKGNVAEKALGRARITCNKNGIPFDPEKPFVTSGLRLGTPAGTTRGFGVAEFKQVGGMIAEVLNALAQSAPTARRRWSKPRSRNGQGAHRPLPDLSVRSEGKGMRCPSCNSLDTQVKDSRPTEDSP
jgi:glycine hydroxymethyltransferase